MPEVPTPGVNGQVVSSPALQASRSMLSLAPAAKTLGWFWSTATAGSFCLFWEKGLVGLPTDTRVSPPWVAEATAGLTNPATKASSPPTMTCRPNRMAPLPRGPAGPTDVPATPQENATLAVTVTPCASRQGPDRASRYYLSSRTLPAPRGFSWSTRLKSGAPAPWLALLGQRRGQRSTLRYLRLPQRRTRPNLRWLTRTPGFRPPQTTDLTVDRVLRGWTSLEQPIKMPRHGPGLVRTCAV